MGESFEIKYTLDLNYCFFRVKKFYTFHLLNFFGLIVKKIILIKYKKWKN